MTSMTAPTFAPLPPMQAEKSSAENPLKGVLITVFTLKVVVAALLLATVSLAPPVSADQRYMAAAAD